MTLIRKSLTLGQKTNELILSTNEILMKTQGLILDNEFDKATHFIRYHRLEAMVNIEKAKDDESKGIAQVRYDQLQCQWIDDTLFHARHGTL